MLSIEEIKERLKDRRMGIVCAETGLSNPTVAGIRDGTRTNPTLAVIKKLSDYLGCKEKVES